MPKRFIIGNVVIIIYFSHEIIFCHDNSDCFLQIVKFVKKFGCRAQVTLHNDNDTITCKHPMIDQNNYVGVHTTTKMMVSDDFFSV
jgi:hypothetical protein